MGATEKTFLSSLSICRRYKCLYKIVPTDLSKGWYVITNDIPFVTPPLLLNTCFLNLTFSIALLIIFSGYPRFKNHDFISLFCRTKSASAELIYDLYSFAVKPIPTIGKAYVRLSVYISQNTFGWLQPESNKHLRRAGREDIKKFLSKKRTDYRFQIEPHLETITVETTGKFLRTSFGRCKISKVCCTDETFFVSEIQTLSKKD